MKKAAAMLIGIVLGISLAGCSGKATAESVYKKAAESWSKKDAVEISLALQKVVDRLCDTICSLSKETIKSITGRKWILSIS